MPGSSHVAVATGTRFISVGGQTGVDAEGVLVGDSYRLQAAQAFRNLDTALQAVGATSADVTGVTIYVVDHGPGAMSEIELAFGDLVAEGYVPAAPPAVLVGVASLWMPGVFVEVSATAVV